MKRKYKLTLETEAIFNEDLEGTVTVNTSFELDLEDVIKELEDAQAKSPEGREEEPRFEHMYVLGARLLRLLAGVEQQISDGQELIDAAKMAHDEGGDDDDDEWGDDD